MLSSHLTKGLPARFKKAINTKHAQISATFGTFDADLTVLGALDKIKNAHALLDASDSQLCTLAKNCEKDCIKLRLNPFDDDYILLILIEYAKRQGVSICFDKKISIAGRINRLTCQFWWRRQLRKTIGRDLEQSARDLGMVSRRAGIYASDETTERRQQQRNRNKNMLKTVVVVNELGQEYTLEQLAALGISNPEIRRLELMTRIAGFDEYAIKHGHHADFITITAPSKFHCIKSDGTPNPKYNESTPRQAQAHLCHVWAKSRAYLATLGIKVYGFRVAEPHHDGTPHWHMVLFYEKKYNPHAIREILKTYALEVDGNEFGAEKHRFQCEPIDRKKGSAAGYLAKYISKNINGAGMDNDDFEGADLSKSVFRVDAWAACWGIRQFQQIGGAPVGVWRELRLLGAVTVTDTGILLDLQHAADSGNWYQYTELQGGALVSRKELSAKVHTVTDTDARGRYDGYGVTSCYGVRCTVSGEIVQTRLHEWVLKRALAPAWSSVNNCNGNLIKKSEGIKNGATDGAGNSNYIAKTRQIEVENPTNRASIVTEKRKRGARGFVGGG